MKHIRSRLLCLTVLVMTAILVSCSTPAYTPAGEVYVKTSPSRGDGGVVEVVDMEVEKAVYTEAGDLTVPVKVGVGHHPSDCEDGETYGYLEVRIWLDVMPRETPTETLRFDYPDWETSKFNSTEPEEAHPFLFIPDYGDFYPLYHETVELNIPAATAYGFIEAELHLVENGNEYTSDSIRIEFAREGDGLRFSADS